MVSDIIALRLRGVSKKYPIYARNIDRIKEAFDLRRRVYHHEYWALRNVDLMVKKGETLGILGVNGSGKSTLLQIVCSILQQTAGEVEVHGRIAALIELGAGFNPELTGRQNAEMNCMITGLSMEATRDILPAIEEFADIGEFFDQPVNTYSSGMFMRVAFATSVHVDPEILIIDEALAVGDARFQQKCFRKFREFQDAGKTILLVTHDRHALPRLCTSAIMLNAGQIVLEGKPEDVCDHYSRYLQLGPSVPAETRQSDADAEALACPDITATQPSAGIPDGVEDICHLHPNYNGNEHRYGQGGAAIVDYQILCGGEKNPGEIKVDSVVDLYVKIHYQQDVVVPLVGFSVKTAEGIMAFSTHSGWLGIPLSSRLAGDVAVYRFSFRAHLAAGHWFLDLAVAENDSMILDTREGIIHFYVASQKQMYGIVSLEADVEEAN